MFTDRFCALQTKSERDHQRLPDVAAIPVAQPVSIDRTVLESLEKLHRVQQDIAHKLDEREHKLAEELRSLIAETIRSCHDEIHQGVANVQTSNGQVQGRHLQHHHLNGIAPVAVLGGDASAKQLEQHTATTSACSTDCDEPARPNSKGSRSSAVSGVTAHDTNLTAFLRAKNWEIKSDAVLAREKTMLMQRPVLEKIVKSTTFDMVVAKVIWVNAIVMALELEYQGGYTARDLGMQADEDGWPGAEVAFLLLEHIFSAFFLLELVLRLKVMGRGYFHTFLNCMDFCVVCIGTLDLWILPLMHVGMPDMSLVKLLRIFRLLRVVRIVRMLRFFEQLRVLIGAVRSSMPVLGWAMITLGVTIVVSSIFITQSLQGFLRDDMQDIKLREELYSYFGTFARSCITMFEVTIAPGTWSNAGRLVIFGVNRNYCLFFLLYLSLVSFAMVRVIAAIFLKETLATAERDANTIMAEINRDPSYVRKIWKIFQELDQDGKGEIHIDDLKGLVDDEQASTWLRKQSIQPHEVRGLFTLMDDGDDSISLAEFITGMFRLKCSAKAVDFPTILYENKKLLKRILDVSQSVQELRVDLGLKASRTTDDGAIEPMWE